MPKVYVSGLAWLDVSSYDLTRIASVKAACTLNPRRTSKHQTEKDLEPIELFQQRESLLGVPREYFMKHRTMDHEPVYRVTPGRKWAKQYASAFTLRDDQPDAVEAVMLRMTEPFGGAVVQAPTGWGKCLGIGTPVLRYDGKIVLVETLKVGDLLMGPDSRPRKILSTCRDHGPLYRIVPTKGGDPWVCNDVHVLTLVHTEDGRIVDVPLNEYLRKSANWKRVYKQFAPENGVEFVPRKDPEVDPYFLGVWFGDGTKSLKAVSVTTMDAEIVQMLRDVAASYRLKVRKEDNDGTKCPTYFLTHNGRVKNDWNELLKRMRHILGKDVRIPDSIRFGSKKMRSEFLAGFIDSDGHNNDGCYEIAQKRKDYAEAIMFIARSLGFFARMRPKVVNGTTYWRIHLHGDFRKIPIRIPRKIHSGKLRHGVEGGTRNKLATRTGFTVEPLDDGEYFGFELDGDGRFLMGNFVVTHNTVFAVEVARRLGVFTAVLVEKEKLRDQWIERIKQQIPGIRVGILQENRCDMDSDVIVCMLDSMTGREHKDLYEQVGFVIADEVHHMGARTRAPILARFSGPWRLGLSAKPSRIDGCERAFYDNIGPKAYIASVRRLTARVFFRKTYWRPITTRDFNPEKVSDQTLLNIMCASVPRNELIVSDLIKAVIAGRKVIVFSARRKHLDTLRDMFARQRPAGKTDGFLRGGMSKKDLQRTDRCDVLWATYEFAKEAYDNPDIDTVLLATPVSDPEQPVGRGTRWKPDKKEPYVLDYVDSGPTIFEKRHDRRKSVYKAIKASIGKD
jgi:superfamily II DNA or RNA helicase